MKCDKCDKEHNGEYASGRFCSEKCARSFATNHNRTLINNKISISMKKAKPGHGDVVITCLYCGKKRQVAYNARHLKYCNSSCAALNLSNKSKQKISNAVRNRVKLGTHNGWPHRDKFYKSYAEKFFSKVLENNKIEYEFNKKVGMYFIDFALNNKIALEIDGKQHNDRKEQDARKDKFLKSNGWCVHRVPWVKNSLLKETVDKFLEFYKERSYV